MPLTKQQKSKIVEELREKIDKQKITVLANFSGIKVEELTTLRKKLRDINAELKIAKKTLAKIVFSEKNIEIEDEKLKNEVAFIFGYEDQISSPKAVYQFSIANPGMKIIGGIMENEYKEAEDIITLAKIPGREELLARLVGSIAFPMSGFVNALQGNMRKLVYVISQIKPST